MIRRTPNDRPWPRADIVMFRVAKEAPLPASVYPWHAISTSATAFRFQSDSSTDLPPQTRKETLNPPITVI